MQSTHYVYHNWTLRKAILHHATCPSCNDGEGIHADKGDQNSAWVPFADRALAEAFVAERKAEGYTDEKTEVCGTCAGDPFEPEIKSSLTSRAKGRISRRAARY